MQFFFFWLKRFSIKYKREYPQGSHYKQIPPLIISVINAALRSEGRLAKSVEQKNKLQAE